MRKILVLLLTVWVMASCGDPNTHYVKKAVRLMVKHGNKGTVIDVIGYVF